MKEATGRGIVWPREKEDPVLGQFIYFNFCLLGVGEQVGELIQSARSCGECREKESWPHFQKGSYPVFWGIRRFH